MSVLKIKDKTGVWQSVTAIRGEDGKSAYEVALANGFKGTEAEWLDSLKSTATDTDLSDYYTKEEVDNKIQEGGDTVSYFSKKEAIFEGNQRQSSPFEIDKFTTGIEVTDADGYEASKVLVLTQETNDIDKYVEYDESVEIHTNLRDIVIYGNKNGLGTLSTEELSSAQYEDYDFNSQYLYENDALSLPAIATYEGGTKITISQDNFTEFYCTDEESDANSNYFIDKYEKINSNETDTLVLPNTNNGYLTDYIMYGFKGNVASMESTDIVSPNILSQKDDILCNDIFRTTGDTIDVKRFGIGFAHMWCVLYHFDAKAPVAIKGYRYRATSKPYEDGELIRETDTTGHLYTGGKVWTNPEYEMGTYELEIFSYDSKIFTVEELQENPYVYVWYGIYEQATNKPVFDVGAYAVSYDYSTTISVTSSNMDGTQSNTYNIVYDSVEKASKVYGKYLRYDSVNNVKNITNAYLLTAFNIKCTMGDESIENVPVYINKKLYEEDYVRLSSDSLYKYGIINVTEDYVYNDKILNRDNEVCEIPAVTTDGILETAYTLDGIHRATTNQPLRIYSGTTNISSNFSFDKIQYLEADKSYGTFDMTAYKEIPYSENISISDIAEDHYLVDYIIYNPKIVGVSNTLFRENIEIFKKSEDFAEVVSNSLQGGAYYWNEEKQAIWRDIYFLDKYPNYTFERTLYEFDFYHDREYTITMVKGSAVYRRWGYDGSVESWTYLDSETLTGTMTLPGQARGVDYVPPIGEPGDEFMIAPEPDAIFTISDGTTTMSFNGYGTYENVDYILTATSSDGTKTNSIVFSLDTENGNYYVRQRDNKLVTKYDLNMISAEKSFDIDDYYTKDEVSKLISNSGSGGGSGYQLAYDTEINTGNKNFDGSPIYLKIFHYDALASAPSGDSDYKTDNVDVENIKDIVDIDAIWHRPDNGQVVHGNYTEYYTALSGTNSSTIVNNFNSYVFWKSVWTTGRISVAGQRVFIGIFRGKNMHYYDCDFYLYYTKKTD